MFHTFKTIFPEKKFFLLFSLLIWIYLWLRAYYIPLVHDEIATFYFYVQPKNFIPFYAYLYGNNHILNSAISSLFYSIFGFSELSLRLGSLLTFPVFVFYLLKLSNEIKNKILRITFVITLLLTHNFIDFFTISRGYGMSMAFLFASLYYLVYSLKETKISYNIYCLIFGCLFVAANLTLISIFFIIIFLLITNTLNQLKNLSSVYRKKIFAGFLFIGLVPLIYFTSYLLQLNKKGLLDCGSLNGFIEVTIKTVLKMITGYNNPVFLYLTFLLFGFLLISFIILVRKQFNLKLISHFKYSIIIVFILSIASIFVLAKFFQINYPDDRTALYLYPLFIISLFFIADELHIKYHYKFFTYTGFIFIFFPIHFFYSMNLSANMFFMDQKIPKSFFNKVNAEHIKGDFPKTIGGSEIRCYCWAYQIYANNANLSVVDFFDYPNDDEDFQIVDINENPNWLKLYDRIDYDKYSNLSLLKRKKFLNKVFINDTTFSTNSETSNEYFNIKEFSALPYINKSIYLGFKMTIDAESEPFNSRIVIQINDNNNKNVCYKFIALNWLKLKYKGEKNNFVNGLLIHKIPGDAAKITAYVWNIDKTKYSLFGNCSLFEIKD